LPAYQGIIAVPGGAGRLPPGPPAGVIWQNKPGACPGRVSDGTSLAAGERRAGPGSAERERQEVTPGLIGSRAAAPPAAARQTADREWPEGEQELGRVRLGEVPPLAEAVTARPETAPDIAAALAPGAALALVTGPAAGLAGPGHAAGRPADPGASGKTQIAAYLAESLWQSEAVDVLIWISATSRAAVLSGLTEAFTAATGLKPAGTAESVARRFAAWLAETSQPWLMILDDLSDPADLEGLWPQRMPAGRILITARHAAVASEIPRVRAVPVGPVSVREAVTFLTGRLSQAPAQRRGAVDLASALGGEVLALAQAAATISVSGMTCADYLGYFAGGWKEFAARPGEAPTAAAVTWLLAVDRAQQMLPGQSIPLMLAMMALLDGHGVPGTVLSAPSVAARLAAVPHQRAFLTPPGGPGELWEDNSRRAWETLLTLERVGLVWVRPGGPRQGPATAGMNAHLQETVLQAAPPNLLEQVARLAATALLEAWPAAEPWPWAAASLRASAASLQRRASAALWAGGCHELLLLAGRSLDVARLTGPAVDHWRELLDVSSRMLGPGSPATVAIAGRLGAAYLAAGRGPDAAACYWQVLAEYGRLRGDRSYGLPPDDPGILAARTGLGRALTMTGEPAAAITVLREAADELARLRGPGHPDTLAVRVALAAACQAVGDAAEATGLLQRAVADSERAHGRDTADTMTVREHLVSAYLAEGHVKDGLAHGKRLLADREHTLGPAHPDTIAARSLLADASHLAGRMTAARRQAEQALADSGRVLGPDHRDTLARSLALAKIYYDGGRLGPARNLLREVAAQSGRVLPPGDPLVHAVQQSLAVIGAG
jgi:hypothetical protein